LAPTTTEHNMNATATYIPTATALGMADYTTSYIETAEGWWITYAGVSTRHGPFPTKKHAEEWWAEPCGVRNGNTT